MPYTFTKQEKEALKQKYIETTNILNSYLPDRCKFKLNVSAFEKKLNDPKTAYIYKKSQELLAKEHKKEEIKNRLWDKYKDQKIEGKPYALDRMVYNDLIPSDDPEAEAYNEEKIRQYILHPEAAVQHRFQKMMQTDLSGISKIAGSDDMDSLKVAFAGKSVNTLEDAFSMVAALEKPGLKEHLTPAMKAYLTSVGKNYEAFIDVAESVKNFDDLAIFLPDSLTTEQDNILNGGDCDIQAEHPDLYRQLNRKTSPNAYADVAKQEFNNFFQQAKEKGIDMSQEDAIINYAGVIIKNGEPEFISLHNWFNVHNYEGEPGLYVLNKDEVVGIQKIFNKDFVKEEGYVEPEIPEKFKEPLGKRARDEFVFQYATDTKKPIYEVENSSMADIAASIGGKWGERVFGTTSPEYKNLIQAMKDYDNPNHVSHQKTGPIKFAANQYLIHKGVKTREEAMALPYPSRDRALLSLDLIESFQKAEGPTEPKMVPGTKEVIAPKPVRWPAIEDGSVVNDDVNPVAQDQALDDLNLEENLDLAGPDDEGIAQ